MGFLRPSGRRPIAMVAALSPELCYSGSKDSAQWSGVAVSDEDRFESYMADRVGARVEDDEAHDPFAAELFGMATTGMATEFVESLLRSVPEETPWAIGEALAECILADDETREICWPWNLVRDRRTPRASLPGADLVGFCKEGEDVVLLFGEVKTSSDVRTPPQVMNGTYRPGPRPSQRVLARRHGSKSPPGICLYQSRTGRLCLMRVGHDRRDLASNRSWRGALARDRDGGESTKAHQRFERWARSSHRRSGSPVRLERPRVAAIRRSG